MKFHLLKPAQAGFACIDAVLTATNNRPTVEAIEITSTQTKSASLFQSRFANADYEIPIFLKPTPAGFACIDAVSTLKN